MIVKDVQNFWSLMYAFKNLVKHITMTLSGDTLQPSSLSLHDIIGIIGIKRFTLEYHIVAPEINISLVPDIVSGSGHFVSVIRNSCRSQCATKISVEDDLSGVYLQTFLTCDFIVQDTKKIA